MLGQAVLTDQANQVFPKQRPRLQLLRARRRVPCGVSSIPAQSSAVLARVVRLDEPDVAGTVTLTDVISGLSGNAVNFSFTMAGRLVNGGPFTTFEGGSFGNLANGKQVQVTGVDRIGFIQATAIRFQ